MWILLAFIAVPLIEIGLFIQVGGLIGLWPTLLIVVITAIVGTAMIRSQGIAALMRLQTSINSLQNPAEPLAHGAMILFSGALLLTPGFFTDAVGFLLLVPGVRTAIYNAVRTKVNVNFQQQQPQNTHHSTVIDGEYTEVDPDAGASKWSKD